MRGSAIAQLDGAWPALGSSSPDPGDTFSAIEGKALDFVEAGATAVLLIDPEQRRATLYRGRSDIRAYGERETIDLSDAVPGWRVALADLFA